MFERLSRTAPCVKAVTACTSASTPAASIAQRIKTLSWAKLAAVSLFAAVIFSGQAASAQSQVSGPVALFSQLNKLAGDGTNPPSATPAPGITEQILPADLVRDRAGNIYISDQSGIIEKLTPAGNLSIFAGGGSTVPTSSAPIAPLNAQLNSPQGLAVDAAGNLYIADTANNLIEEVSSNGATLTVIAGGGADAPSTTPDTPTRVQLLSPYDVAVDNSGNIYIADTVHFLIEEINISTGLLSVIAGGASPSTPFQVSDTSPVPATSVFLAPPTSIALDNFGNLYLPQRSSDTILQLNLANQTLLVIAGPIEGAVYTASSTPTAAVFTQIPQPSNLTVNAAGDVFSVDGADSTVLEWNHATQQVFTFATPSGYFPVGVALQDIQLDSSGNLYAADDGNNVIFEVTPNTSFPTTAVGSTSTSQTVDVQLAASTALSGITVLPAQSSSQEFTVGSLSASNCVFDGVTVNPSQSICIVPVTFSPSEPGLRTGALTVNNGGTVVGTVGLTGTGTAPQVAFSPGVISTLTSNAQVNAPSGVVLDAAGNIYIADTSDNAIRKIDTQGNITTIAGTGASCSLGAPPFCGDGGPATSAQLNGPVGIAIDAAGNLYISDTSDALIRKIDATTQIITTVAGNGNANYSGDGGLAVNASLSGPEGLAFGPDGNLYIADEGNCVIREYFPSDGSIATVVGIAFAGASSGDGGPALSAGLNFPSGVAVDAAGDIYISDTFSSAIRKVTAATGIINLYAGSYSASDSGDGGLPTNAQLASPAGLALDAAGNLYIADPGNNNIRIVTSDPRNPLIYTVAGDPFGSSGFGGDGGSATLPLLSHPFDVAVDPAGNLYIADTGNSVYRLVTVATTPPVVFPSTMGGMTSIPSGALLYNTGNSALDFVRPATGTNPSIANGFALDTVGSFTCPSITPLTRRPRGFAPGDSCLSIFDFQPTLAGNYSGSLIFTDNALNVAGAMQSISLTGDSTAGSASQLTFTPPPPPLLAAGGNAGVITVTITDAGGNPITGANSSSVELQVLDPTSAITTYGPFATSNGVVTFDLSAVPVIAGTYTYTAIDETAVYLSATASETVLGHNQSALPAIVGNPATQPSTLIVGIPVNFTIGSIQMVTQGIANLDFTIDTHDRGTCRVGHAYTAGQTCTVNYFFNPTAPGLRLGAVRLFDTTSPTPVLEATALTSGIGIGPLSAFVPGVISNVAGSGSGGYNGDGLSATDSTTELNIPGDAVTDAAGNLFIADTANNVVRRVDGVTHIITTYAGNGTPGLSGDGTLATGAQLIAPNGLAIDGNGTLYIADTGNSVIRKVDPVTQIITTYAGSPHAGAGFSGDGGPAYLAQLSSPNGISVSNSLNDLFIADTGNNRIREVSSTSGNIKTIAGNGTAGFGGDGLSPTDPTTELNAPAGVTVDLSDAVVVADTGNNRVRFITSGLIQTIVGNGTAGFAGDGLLITDPTAELNGPTKVAVDPLGDVYIADTGNFVIRRADVASGLLSTLVGTGGVQGASAVMPSTTAPLGTPGSVFVDQAGNLFIADQTTSIIREVNVSVTPDLNFGSINAGTTAGPINVGYASIGTEPSLVTGITVPPDFTVNNGACDPLVGSELSAGICNFAITFAPTESATFSSTGSPASVLTINTANPLTSNALPAHTIGLNGTGLPNGPATELIFVNPPANPGTYDPNFGEDVAGVVTAGVADPGGFLIPTASDTITLNVSGPSGYTATYGPTPTVNGIATFDLSAVPLFAQGTYTYTLTSGNAPPYNSATVEEAVTLQTTVSNGVSQTSSNVPVVIAITRTFTLGSISVVTTGLPNLDFTLDPNPGTCTVGVTYHPGDTCTVGFDFTPRALGQRVGAVLLYDQSTPAVVQASELLLGDGNGSGVALTPGVITTIAGNIGLGAGYSGDGGLARSAQLIAPQASVIDAAGNIYIVDGGNNTIRRVDAVTGNISTFAGIAGPEGYSGDGGPAVNAQFAFPVNISIDGAGNLYIADSDNGVIRRIDTNGIITTVAGNFNVFTPNDGGPATNAGLNEPASARVDPSTGNLFIADTRDNRIRMVNAATGIISTIAGNGTQGNTGDGGAAASAELNNPSDIAVPNGNTYVIADSGNNRIREVNAGMINALIGNGTAGYAGDGQDRSNTELNDPLGIAVDAAGDIYIADTGNFAIRRLDNGTGIVTTVAGNGTGIPRQVPTNGVAATASALGGPASVTLDASGNLYITDYFNGLLNRVNTGITPALSFGIANVGSVSAPQTVRVLNFGDASLASPGIVLPTNFILDTSGADTQACPMPLSNLLTGSACNLDIDFAPVEGAPSPGAVFSATGTPPAVATYTSTSQPIIMFNIGLNGTSISGSAAQVGFFNNTPPAIGYTGNSPGIVEAGDEDTNGFLITNASDTITLSVTGPAGFTFAPLSAPTVNGIASFDLTALKFTIPGTYTYTLTSSITTPVALTSASATEAVANSSVAVGSVSLPVITSSPVQTATVVFTATATLGAINVTTEGNPSLDFQFVSGGSCVIGNTYTPGNMCTVDFTFTPQAVGQRLGAIQFLDNSATPVLLTTIYLSGIGSGPLAALTPGIISTFAGDNALGSGYFGDNGPATSAQLSNPARLTFDASGNLYIADLGNLIIRKVDTSGNITTIAGAAPGSSSFGADGSPALGAFLNGPAATAIDGAGNLYIADQYGATIRKVDANTGLISTIAGNGPNGGPPYGDGGPATSSTLSFPVDIAVDTAGNLYIVDAGLSNIRKITAATGIITTVAGGGISIANPPYGDGGLATSATLLNPKAIAVDTAGNLYIADANLNSVRKVDAVTGIISTYAGGGQDSNSHGDGGLATLAALVAPEALALDAAGDLYIADDGHSSFRKVAAATGIITTVAGSGLNSYQISDDGGSALAAATGVSYGIAVDPAGNLYMGDQPDNIIRKVTVTATPDISFPNTDAGLVSTSTNFTLSDVGTAALTTSAATINSNFSVTATTPVTCPLGSSATTTIASGVDCVYSVAFAPTTIGEFVGPNTTPGVTTLPVFLNTEISFTDNALNTIPQTIGLNGTAAIGLPTRLIFTTPPPAVVPTGGSPGLVAASIEDDFGDVVTNASDTISFTLTGPGGFSQSFNGVLTILGALFYDFVNTPLLEVGTYTLTAVSSNGYISGVATIITVPGNVSVSTPVAVTSPVTASAVQTVTVGFNNTFTAGSITAVTQGVPSLDFNVVSGGTCAVGHTYNSGNTCTVNFTFSPTAPGQRFGAILVESNDATPVLESSTLLSGIGTGPLAALTPGIVNTIVGGSATATQLTNPEGVAVDAAGDLYITDVINNGSSFIRKLDTHGNLTIVAGNGTYGYAGDGSPATGPGVETSFARNIALDGAGNIFFADQSNGVIRRVDAVSGIITTVAGELTGNSIYTTPPWGDGEPATFANLSLPAGLAVDAAGNLYIADFYHGLIRKVDNAGVITTVVGGGTPIDGVGDGLPATQAELSFPSGVVLDANGNIYIVDNGNNEIREVNASTGIIDPVVISISGLSAVSLDPAGNVYSVSQYAAQVYRTSAATGALTTVAGNGSTGYLSTDEGAAATTAEFNFPQAVVLDGAGNLYIADSHNALVRKVSVGTTVPLSFATTQSGNSTAAQSFALSNDGNANLATTSVTAPSDFTVSVAPNTCPATSAAGSILAGVDCLYSIAFTPVTVHTYTSPSSAFIAADTLGTQTVSLNAISTAPTIVVAPTTGATTALTAGAVAASYSQQFTASGGVTPYSFTSTTLPAGLTLSSTGLLSGTPTAGGNFSLTVTATDSTTGPSAPYTGSQAYTLTINPPTIVVPQTTLPTGTVAATYTSSQFTASGGTAPYTYTATGLPAGLSLSTSGLLTGTPTAGGPFTVVVTAHDSSTGTGPYTGSSTTISLTINAPTIVVPQTTLPIGTVAATFTPSQFTASGGTAPYTYTATGLPAGLSLSTTGLLTGTPTAGGVFSVVVTAHDSSTGTGPYTGLSAAISLTINAPTIVVTQTTLPAAAIAANYSQQLSAGGGTSTYSFTSTTLPAGLTLSSTGLLSGTPTAGGVFSITFTAHDSSTGTGPFTGQQIISLTVNPPTIVVPQTTLSAGTVSAAYTSPQFTASGGTSGYTFTATGLPAGLTLNATTGVITGTPTAGGIFSVVVTAHDSSTGTGPFTGSSAPISLTINAPTVTLTPTTTTLPLATGNVAYSQQFTAGGGTAPYAYTITSGTLPTGITLNINSGLLSGTTLVPANTFNFTVTATDSSTGTGPYTKSIAYSLPLNPAAPVANPVNTNVVFNSTNNTIPLNLTGGLAASVAVASPASHGTATASGTTITYTPVNGYTGTDSFTYTATNITSTSAAALVSIQVGKIPTTVTIGNLSPTYNAAPQVATATTVITSSGIPVTVASITITYNGSSTPPTLAGPYTVVATVVDPQYQGTATATMNIAKAPTSVALVQTVPTTTGVGTGVATTFVATVSAGSVGTPTGSVQFFDGLTSLGISPMTAGVATLTTTFTTVATHSITAVYLSDTNFATNTSAIFNESVVTPGFTGTASPSSLTIEHGNSGTTTLTFTPFGNYQGTLTFSCNSLPIFVSCQFTPPTIVFTGNNAVQTTTLQVFTLNASAQPVPSTSRILWIPAVLLACLVAMRRKKLTRGLRSVLMLAIAALAMTAMTGCGSGTTFVTPVGTATVTVTASATGTGGNSSQTITLTITITP